MDINIFAKDYVRRWRVVSMLKNIKNNIHNPDLPKILDSYIRFAESIDEDKWEQDFREGSRL